MKPVTLDLPQAEIVFMTLFDSLSLDWLDEDLGFIRLGDGSKIEVGWYGKLGRGGHFKVVHYKDSWHRPLEVVQANSVDKVRETLSRMASAALWATIAVSTAKSEKRDVSWLNDSPVRSCFGSTTKEDSHVIQWA